MRAGCRIGCVEVVYGPNNPLDLGLCRRKWNYVKNVYTASYAIDGSGNHVDPRQITDESYIVDAARWDSEFQTDYDNWVVTHSGTDFEKWLQWRYEKGTYQYANLPQWKKSEHVGYCWMPCPYSTDSDDIRSEIMLGSVPSKVDHGIYYMKAANSGNVWGFECTYSGCPYLLTNGTRYFYV